MRVCQMVFLPSLKLRTASSLPRSQRSSVYETPGEKVSVESFVGTKILQISPHGPVCLAAVYMLFLMVTVCFFSIRVWYPSLEDLWREDLAYELSGFRALILYFK